VLAVRKPLVTVEVDAPQLAMLAGAEEERLALPAPDQVIETQQMAERVTSLLPLLPDREADILCRRFELGGRAQETLEAVGDSWGISKERTRSLQEQALGRLRRLLRELDESEGVE
jgi:DNA-directed RNA polymerase sigma subunit (sigma70/sigma32)